MLTLPYISYLPDGYIDLKIFPKCSFLPYFSYDILHNDICTTLKFDLFGLQNDLEMTFEVKIFSGIHPTFSA